MRGTAVRAAISTDPPKPHTHEQLEEGPRRTRRAASTRRRPAAFVNGNLFAGLHEDRLMVRLPAEAPPPNV